jgi:hypothetical protein
MCVFHYMKHGHVCLSLRETCPCVPFITWNMAMCAFHYVKHGHVCHSLCETWPCMTFIMWNMAMCVFHYMKHGHVCLSLRETCPCVPFITWNMAMCAFHYEKHGHVCLSLHETWPCVPFIKWNMSTYAYHYMMHISLHAVTCIIIILFITFMHGMYNYVPDTNHISRLYSVAAVLYIQFMLHAMLFCPWNMFCMFTSALPTVCGQCPMWLFFVVP